MSTFIVPIVEGHGEEAAVPALVTTILEKLGTSGVYVARPLRKHRNKIVKPQELEQAIRLAIKRRKNVGAVLVLLDADDDCPAKLGPQLLARARKVRADVPVAVVFAKREFEAWFLGCKEAFRGFMGIPTDAHAPDNAEDVSAKGRLQSNMRGAKYIPSIHMVDFVRKMHFDRSRERCPSFDKLLRDVEYLVREMKKS